MTSTQLISLFRVTPHRLFCLALWAPAIWVIWIVTDRDPAKAILLLIAMLWIIVVGRTWSWFVGGKPAKSPTN